MKIKQILSYVLQPFLIAFYPALDLFSQNTNGLMWLHIIFAIIIIFTITSLLFLLSSLLYQNVIKGALLTNVSLLTFFLFNPFWDHIFEPLFYAAQHIRIGNIKIFRQRYLLLLVVIILLYIAYKIARKPPVHTFFLKVLVFPLLLLSMLLFSQSFFHKSKETPTIQKYENVNKPFKDQMLKDLSRLKHKLKTFPNIYFIILDCYPSNEHLMKYFNYDNKVFLSELKKQGFFIAKKSLSNYPQTAESLSATLNMNYLPHDLPNIPFTHMMKNNNVKDFLTYLGYKYVDISLTSPLIKIPINTNKKSKRIKTKLLHEFKKFLFDYHHFRVSFIESKTPLHPFVKPLFLNKKRQTIKRKLSLLKDATLNQNTKFVYAHLSIPHWPQVFDEYGKPIKFDYSSQTVWQCTEYGVTQSIKYINKEILKLVDLIKKTSKIEPIIIIQGDHAKDYTDRENRPLKMRFQILNACLLPGGGEKLMYNNISPVNTFRVIFNHYFGTNLPLLKDKSYVPDYHLPENLRGNKKYTPLENFIF